MEPASEQPVGFGHSKRRIGSEIALIVGGLLLLVLGSIKLASCTAGWMVGFVPISADETLGESAWSQLLPEADKCTDPATLAYVNQITQPLVDALGRDGGGFKFEFAVSASEDVNAYALPGGFVTINLGLLKKAESGEEIAGVVGHEMFHVISRHGMVRILRSAGGRIILGLAVGWTDVGALASYVGNIVDLKYDRDQERQADEQGRALLKKAGIDPSGMAQFFARLAKEGGASSAMPTILTTHPSHDERVEASLADGKGFSPTVKLPVPPNDLRCH